MLVGADFNQEALVATADHFMQKGVEGHFIWGDIGDPDQLAIDLYEKHDIRLSELMSVRSFLDHNRVYNEPVLARPDHPASTGVTTFRGRRPQTAQRGAEPEGALDEVVSLCGRAWTARHRVAHGGT